MPKFVWEISSKGAWRPQLFHGELPREMTARENVHRYAVHELSDGAIRIFERQAKHAGKSVLDQIALVYPPPAPEPRGPITLRVETETETVREIINVD